MKDIVTKCTLQAIVFSIILMLVNFMFGGVNLPFLSMPVSIPLDWIQVVNTFLMYWCLSFFVLFTIEAMKN